MHDFLVQNFFGIICCIAAFGITYILRNISNNILDLQKEYKQLLGAGTENKLAMLQNIHEIKEMISGQYVRKSEIGQLIEFELNKRCK